MNSITFLSIIGTILTTILSSLSIVHVLDGLVVAVLEG